MSLIITDEQDCCECFLVLPSLKDLARLLSKFIFNLKKLEIMSNLVELKKEELMEIEGGGFLESLASNVLVTLGPALVLGIAVYGAYSAGYDACKCQ